MTRLLFITLTALSLAASRALSADETEFRIFTVESSGAEFKRAVARVAPRLAKHITLPSKLPNPSELMSWRVCDIKPGDVVAVVSQLRTKEIPANHSSIRIRPDPPEPNMVSLVFSYHVPDGPWVPSSNGFRPNDTMCLAFAAPDRKDGYRIFLILRK